MTVRLTVTPSCIRLCGVYPDACRKVGSGYWWSHPYVTARQAVQKYLDVWRNGAPRERLGP